MSFSGHPVSHLGLNWCILLGLFYILQVIIWDLGDIIWYIYIFYRVLSTNVFICYHCLVIFSILDKNLWFSSQRRREGVVGDVNDN